jgi:xanthine dehydrogenase accessory factor
VTIGNPCLSGGALDIFLEVMRPPALVHLYGDTPVARALTVVGEAAGLDVRATTTADVPVPADATAVVVASQGGDEHQVLQAALGSGVPYIGLLASRRRGAGVLDALGLDAEQRARVHTPAGLDIGAQSPGEVAVSILAEIIAAGATTHPFLNVGTAFKGMPALAGGGTPAAAGNSAADRGGDLGEPPAAAGGGTTVTTGTTVSTGTTVTTGTIAVTGATIADHCGHSGETSAAAGGGTLAAAGASTTDRGGHPGEPPAPTSVTPPPTSVTPPPTSVTPPPTRPGLREAVDPVCGMSLIVSARAIQAESLGRAVYFCCPGCRDAYLADPGRYTHSL